MLPALDGLKVLSTCDLGLSQTGTQGIKQLAADLSGFTIGSSAWDVLSAYLLDLTNTAQQLSQAKTPAEFMRAIAVWQFLNFAREQPLAGKGPPIKRFLDRIRQMVLFADDRELRHMPDAALSLDAVRLMTVHGSKGLEFEAVHIASLITTSFPLSPKTPRCLPPIGLITGTGSLSVTDESKLSQMHEEECLFFVALSRARTYLRLYLSTLMADGNKKRKPSKFLDWLNPKLVPEVASPATANSRLHAQNLETIEVAWTYAPSFSDSRLATFAKCPRRFFYTSLLGLAGIRKQTAFTQTHGCIFELIRWIADARTASEVSLTDVLREFDRIWNESGPVDHAFAFQYRKLADNLAKALHESGTGRKFRKTEQLALNLINGKIIVEPNEIGELPDGTTVLRRIRTGAKKDSEYDALEYTLYHFAGQETYGDTT